MKEPPNPDAYGVLIEPATLKIERLLPGPSVRVWGEGWGEGAFCCADFCATPRSQDPTNRPRRGFSRRALPPF